MTSFLAGIERSGGNVIEDAMATAAALWVYDNFLKEKMMDVNDPAWMHLAKQTGVVVACNELVQFARNNGWIPHIFG